MASEYYALSNPNPNATRKGYPGFWGYTTMNHPPRAVVIHTTESLADLDGPDNGAENVANWFQTNDTFALYHTLVDGDSTVRLVPAGLDGTTACTAFHAAGYNSFTLGVSMALQAASWPTLPDAYRNRVLDRAAAEVAPLCRRWSIPVVARTKTEIDAGASGVTGHGILDPGYRSDPGAGFPWADFLNRVQAAANPTTGDEDLMLSAFLLPTGNTVWVHNPATGAVVALDSLGLTMAAYNELVAHGKAKPFDPSRRMSWEANALLAYMDAPATFSTPRPPRP